MFNKPSEKINLNSPDPNSDIYISEGERFNKDFAAYDYNRRNIEHETKKEPMDNNIKKSNDNYSYKEKTDNNNIYNNHKMVEIKYTNKKKTNEKEPKDNTKK